MKFKTYLAEEKGADRRTIDMVLKKAYKQPKTFLDTNMFTSMDELKFEVGGDRQLKENIAYTLEYFADEVGGVTAEQIGQGYLAGKFTLVPDDRTIREMKKYFGK